MTEVSDSERVDELMGEAGLWGGSLECLWAGALAGEGAGLEQGLVDPTPCQAGEGGGGSSSGKGARGAPPSKHV